MSHLHCVLRQWTHSRDELLHNHNYSVCPQLYFHIQLLSWSIMTNYLNDWLWTCDFKYKKFHIRLHIRWTFSYKIYENQRALICVVKVWRWLWVAWKQWLGSAVPYKIAFQIFYVLVFSRVSLHISNTYFILQFIRGMQSQCLTIHADKWVAWSWFSNFIYLNIIINKKHQSSTAWWLKMYKNIKIKKLCTRLTLINI